MNVTSRVFGCLLAAAGAWPGTCPAAEPPAAPPVRVAFAEFSGVCQGGNRPDALRGVAGWNRFDISWQQYEPAPGEVREDYLVKMEAKIRADLDDGRRFLPMLGYAAEWAMAGEFSVDVSPFERREYERRPDGKYRVKTHVRDRAGDPWRLSADTEAKRVRAPLAPQFVAAWEKYVETVVRRLMAPPFGIEYFQVWNEAHPTSGFFHGDLDAYMATIHLPAARVIRRLGGKVVYGGWPCAGPVKEFVALLDRHDAWDTVDVLSVHYHPLASFVHLDRAMRQRGVSGKGLWQTEFGFVPDVNFVGNNYPRVLRWSLSRGWTSPHDHKLFYFAQGSPDDPKAYGYGRCLMSGKNLSPHGAALATLARLLEGGDIRPYDAVATTPPLAPSMDERLSSLEGFRVGDRIVLAVHLIESNTAKILVDAGGDTLHLNHGDPVLAVALPGIAPGRVRSIERVGQFGRRTDLRPRMATDGEGLLVTVPVREARDKDPDYVDMPMNVLPQTFYLAVELAETATPGGNP